jgi:hypothetical protein
MILNMGGSYAENEMAQQVADGASAQVPYQAGAWEQEEKFIARAFGLNCKR